MAGWCLLLVAPFIGSFLGTVIRRLPEGRPIVLSARSGCEVSGARLAPGDLVPLVSWRWHTESAAIAAPRSAGSIRGARLARLPSRRSLSRSMAGTGLARWPARLVVVAAWLDRSAR